MRMKGMYSAAFVLSLLAAGATPADAADLTNPTMETGHQIVIVNDNAAPVKVYGEDAEGRLHEMARLAPGEVKLVDSPAGSAERLHVRPTDSKDALSTWGREGIKTEALSLNGAETVVFWLGQDLAQSMVEIRTR